MQAQSLEKKGDLLKTCGKVEKPVEMCGKLSLAAIRSAGGLMFFYPGPPMWRRSGLGWNHHVKEYAAYKLNLCWAAKAAARANGPEWERQHMPMSGAIVLGLVVFRMAPPTKKPDLDNYLKLVADAFTGTIYADDAQITEYFPGSRKEESPTQGIRVILVPAAAMPRLGYGDTHEF